LAVLVKAQFPQVLDLLVVTMAAVVVVDLLMVLAVLALAV
jgi:hypothetical protein